MLKDEEQMSVLTHSKCQNFERGDPLLNVTGLFFSFIFNSCANKTISVLYK